MLREEATMPQPDRINLNGGKNTREAKQGNTKFSLFRPFSSSLYPLPLPSFSATGGVHVKKA